MLAVLERPRVAEKPLRPVQPNVFLCEAPIYDDGDPHMYIESEWTIPANQNPFANVSERQ